MPNLLIRATRRAAAELPVKTVRSRLARPIASLTFDDFPRSAWTAGGPILDDYGARATYYAAGSFMGRTVENIAYFDAEDLQALRACGHEVGCHSFSHDQAPSLATAELMAEADRNAAHLAPWLCGVGLSSYAYPYGEVSPRAKLAMARRFASARGIRPGVNAGLIDLAQLKAVPLESRSLSRELVAKAIVQARAANGWLVFFTHDVDARPSPYGCTPEALRDVLEQLARAGIEVLPVKHAMAEAVFGVSDGHGKAA